jgi:uncharacterized protein YjiS (DUF1127 family)
VSILVKRYTEVRPNYVGGGDHKSFASVQRPFARLTYLLAHWRSRSRLRGQLAQFSRRELLDIGITPADRERECGKPFWRN